MINIPSARSMRERANAAKADHVAEVIEANEEWFRAAINCIYECAASGYTVVNLSWPNDVTSYADRRILSKQFRDAGYIVDETRDAIANYCIITW